jgi:hypothetical protein
MLRLGVWFRNITVDEFKLDDNDLVQIRVLLNG